MEFDVGAILLSGKFGRVYLSEGKGEDGASVLSVSKKAIVDTFETRREMENEAELLQACQSEHVIRLLRVERDEAKVHFLHMERADETLFEYANRHLEEYDTKREYMLQLRAAVSHIHGLDVVHRDLKLENVALSGGRVKLIDFGLAVRSADGMVSVEGGSPHYAAPELFVLGTRTVDGKKADAWSFGIVCFGLLFQTLPFALAHRSHSPFFAMVQDRPGRLVDLMREHGDEDMLRRLTMVPEHLVDTFVQPFLVVPPSTRAPVGDQT